MSLFSFAQLQFTENKGQWDKAIDYKSEIQNGAFFLQRAGFTILLQNAKDLEEFGQVMHGHVPGENKSLSKNTVNHFIIRSLASIDNLLPVNNMQKLFSLPLPTLPRS